MTTDNHTVSAFAPSTGVHALAQPFLLGSGSDGILFIHGFGGSIGDARPLAEEFARRGWRAGGVRLAGHGQTPADLAQAHIPDWRQSVFLAARELKTLCRRIVLVGSSFGGGLAIDYAVHAPDRLAAIVTVNTGLRYRGGGRWQELILKMLRLGTPYYQKRFRSPLDRERALEVGSLESWPISGILENYEFLERFVRPALPRLTVPLLTMIGVDDPIVDLESARELFGLAGSSTKQAWEYRGHAHNPSRDPELRQLVIDRITSFLNSVDQTDQL